MSGKKYFMTGKVLKCMLVFISVLAHFDLILQSVNLFTKLDLIQGKIMLRKEQLNKMIIHIEKDLP